VPSGICGRIQARQSVVTLVANFVPRM